MSQGKKLNWTPKMDILLGKTSDREVAKKLGINQSTVFYRREELGIPAFGPPNTVWTPEMDALLGTASDAKVAEQLRLPGPHVVLRRRHRLGTLSWKSQTRVLPKGVSRDSPEGERFHARRRRHKVRSILDTLTYEQWKFACEWFDNRCAYCGKEVFLTEDHLRPLSKGGPRTVLNIIPACWTCNNSKCARLAHLWIYERFGMEEGKVIVERIVAYLTEISGSGDLT